MLAVRGFLAYPHSYSRGATAWHAGDIVSVPIDETAQALARLKTLPFACPRAGIYGASRGAELALLLAGLTSSDGHPGLPDAVATFATADTVHGPFLAARAPGAPKRRMGDGDAGSAELIVQGETQTAWTWRGGTDRLTTGARIEIEHYRHPVFLSHGAADTLWSAAMTQRLAARLTATGAPPECHIYEGEGHRLSAKLANQHMDLVEAFFRRTICP
jgi:acetyl esterase/lipase